MSDPWEENGTFPCQGPSPDCTWEAPKPFGLCSACEAFRDARDAETTLGSALGAGGPPWHHCGELDALCAPRDLDSTPPRALWAVESAR